ncbi:MAG: glycosyltransferase family 39 protein [Candidatus Aminicenantes bacterium]|nr:MAG: glycosyltransferase family 39 protein [Candidatus Aminicenantes bacterium]
MTKTALNKEYFLAFFIIWIFFYLFFPSWLFPVSTANRALIYVALLAFFLMNGGLFYKWNVPYVKEKLFNINKDSIFSFLRSNKILTAVFLLFSVLQIYPMLMPLRTRGDEGYHANNGLEILKMINIKVGHLLPIDFHWIFKLLVVFLIMIFIVVRRVRLKSRVAGIIKNKYLLIAGLSIFFIVYFISVLRFPYSIRMHRFPPISKLIHTFTYLLFSPSEFIVRLPQLIFTLLAAVFLFKTVSLYRERREALFAALTFLCLPLVISFANDGRLASGTMFFMILVSYFFMRHLKFHTHRDFILTVFSISLAFLYKRPLLIMIAVIWIFLFLRGHIKFDREFWSRFSYYLKFTWIGLVPIIPWLVITKFLPGREYHFSVKNWLNMDIVLIYLKGLPKTTGLFLALILVISLVYCMGWKRDWLFKYFLVLFFLVYILITSDAYMYRRQYMIFRFASYFSPSVAIFASAVIFACLEKIRKKSAGVMATVFLFLLLFLCSSVIPPQYTGIDSRLVMFYKIKSRYAPYDQALSYVSKNFSQETRFHAAFGPTPVNFYAYKYNALNQQYKLKAEENFDITMWKYPDEQTFGNLHAYCSKNNIDYFMFPSAKWTSEYISESLIDDLRDEKKSGHKFKMVKEFEFGGNYVYISKVLK